MVLVARHFRIDSFNMHTVSTHRQYFNELQHYENKRKASLVHMPSSSSLRISIEYDCRRAFQGQYK